MNGNPYPTVRVVAGADALVSTSGGRLLTQTAEACGLAVGLSTGLAGWRSPRSVHDPGKVLLDLAVAIAVGGDCLSDVAVVRAQPQVFGAVASDPTVSRLLDSLAADVDEVLAAIRAVRAGSRGQVWSQANPVGDGPVVVDLDATLVGAHSDKDGAAPNYKRGFGFHPLLAFADHGPGGAGEPLAAMLRPGNAGSSTAADHIVVLDAAIAQLPAADRGRVLVRADSAGGTKEFLGHVAGLGLDYCVGMAVHDTVDKALADLPRQAWRKAVDAAGAPREQAYVAELTAWWTPGTARGTWPAGMRLIARREKAHPGAQLRIGEDDGWRTTVFATNLTDRRLADLERVYRLRARAEDRIRHLKDTGLTNLPLHDFAKNQIWTELAQLAYELLVWTQLLAWPDTAPARVWEPKTLRLRILSVAGRIVTSGRRQTLRISHRWPWKDLILLGHHHLAAL